MNMHSSGKIIPVIFSAFLLFSGCTKEKNVSYGVNDKVVYEDKSLKTKRKSDAEYISILYTNLYQVPISPTRLYKTQNVVYSIGDRNVANEMVLSNYFNTSTLKIPKDSEMRADVAAFVEKCYKRFFLRYPSEGEKTFFINYINSNPNVSVEMVYTAFSVSDEYQYY
ncbi:MAG: hypothetical protein FJ347_00405 [Sphingomonadales bacterium]|nr:hypothetical protein [Sphingomonadales bacterium]